MGPVRLPRYTVLSAERGNWILRWNEQTIGLSRAAEASSLKLTRIGSSAGPDALSEIDARRLARRYLLSRLPAVETAKRSLTTIVEFIETRYFPDIIAGKSLAWRAHYHSILKHILSPDDVERLFLANNGGLNTKRDRQPHWPYLGHLRIRDVRPHHVCDLIETALEAGYSPQTVRHIHNVISAIFTYAKQELVFQGISPTYSAKMREIESKCVPSLTLEQIEQVLQAMRYPEKQMTMIALFTDLNISEICGLKWKHVNLTGALLDQDGDLIPPITIAVKNRWYRGELADVKEKRRRNIRIPEKLLSTFLLLSARPSFTGPEDFVLTSRLGTAINVSNLTSRRLGLLGKKLGVRELTLQSLRRAQGLIQQGNETPFEHRIEVECSSDYRAVRSI